MEAEVSMAMTKSRMRFSSANFHWFHEGQVAVQLEPVGVEHVIELVVVYADLLAHAGELAQEGPGNRAFRG